MLSLEEKNRYSRHISLDRVGIEGQEKLKNASVLVVGAGGLGCPALQYLTAAGVGTIGIIDFDKIEESNLQRQVLFTVSDIGKNKAVTAKNHLKALNPTIKIDCFAEALTTKNALQLFEKYDIIVDGTDNFSTRYLINDACTITNKPLVYGAIDQYEGQVTVFNYQDGPSYRCLFPNPPKAGSVKNCSDNGVLGVLPGIIGVQQATEVLKMILGIGTVLSGKLQLYNALDSTFTMLTIPKSDTEIGAVLAAQDSFEYYDYDFFCGVEMEAIKSIQLDEFKLLLNDPKAVFLDVRECWEQPRIKHQNVIEAPLDELDDFVHKIPTDMQVIVCCQKGGRSLIAIDFLEKEYDFKYLYNLDGGMSGLM